MATIFNACLLLVIKHFTGWYLLTNWALRALIDVFFTQGFQHLKVIFFIFFLLQYSDIFPESREKTSAHAHPGHLTAERYRYIEVHRCNTERDADCLREGPSPARIKPSNRRGATGNTTQRFGGLHPVHFPMKCSRH